MWPTFDEALINVGNSWHILGKHVVEKMIADICEHLSLNRYRSAGTRIFCCQNRLRYSREPALGSSRRDLYNTLHSTALNSQSLNHHWFELLVGCIENFANSTVQFADSPNFGENSMEFNFYQNFAGLQRNL